MEESRRAFKRRQLFCTVTMLVTLLIAGGYFLKYFFDLEGAMEKEFKLPQRNDSKLDEISDRIGYGLEKKEESRKLGIKSELDSLAIFGVTYLLFLIVCLWFIFDLEHYIKEFLRNLQPQHDKAERTEQTERKKAQSAWGELQAV